VELPDRLQFYTTDGERALERVHRLGLEVDSALVRRASLEDVFLRLTGHSLVE
jgi:lipooligosaccharide transport system ATP-binding protein